MNSSHSLARCAITCFALLLSAVLIEEARGQFNNTCTSAGAVGNGNNGFSTVGATTDGASHTQCNVSGSSQIYRDVWALYLASCTGTLTVDICDSTFDTRLAVYAGAGCSGITPIACIDDNCGTGNLRSRATLSVTSGQTYRIRIGAFLNSSVNGQGVGSGTCVISCSGPQPPASPTDLVAVGSSDDILLQWSDNSTNEDGFRIERKLGTANWVLLPQIVPPSPGTGTVATQDSNLPFGNTYRYRVYAFNAAGLSQFYTNEQLATTLATPQLTSPLNNATVSNPVSLDWNNVSGAEVYGIDMGTSCGATTILNNQAASSSSYTLTLPLGTYVWRVRAANGSAPGVSTASECRSFTVGVSPPAAFTLSNDSPVCDTSPPGPSPAVQLNWNASAGATSYRLYRDGGLYASGITGLAFYNSANLVAGQTYTYFVQAVNSGGTRDSNTIEVSIPSNICAQSVPDIRVEPNPVTLMCPLGAYGPTGLPPVESAPNALARDRNGGNVGGSELDINEIQAADAAGGRPRPCSILMPDGAGARSAYSTNRWPLGVIPYRFSDNVSTLNRERAVQAMARLENVANVDFVLRDSQPNHLLIQDSSGNNSYVGMQGGEQIVNIANWGVRFIMVHEFMHALGFWHEQQRSDSTNLLDVQTENICQDCCPPGASSCTHNFLPQPLAVEHGDYDFDSVMHYDQYAWSTNGLPTIVVLPPNQEWQDQIGQGGSLNHLSEGDIAGLQFRYGHPVVPGSGCFTIYNDGPGTLLVTSVTGPSWATLVPPPPYSIPADSALQVCVQACGSCDGSDLDAALTVNSNDPDEPSVLVSVHVDCPAEVIPPIIVNISNDSIQAPDAYTGPLPSLVQGSQPVDWSLVAGPSGMTINESNGVVFWASSTPVGSPHGITIRATNIADFDNEFWSLTVTPCPADFNGDGARNVADIFAFLNAWFANEEVADFDGSGLPVAVPDIFAFLSVWFAGCP